MEPVLSVIIPTRDRLSSLTEALAALSRQQLPREEFEVIVVDDGSNAKPVASMTPLLSVRTLTQPHAGPGAARNRGALAAHGRFLCFIDSDCRPTENWLCSLKKRFDVDPEAAYGGCTLNALRHCPGDAACQATTDAVASYFLRDGRQPEFFPAQNLAFPAAPFRALGGFHPGFPFAAEDRELCDRWRKAGRRLILVPEAVVYHCHGLTPAGFLHQQFRYGQGAFRFSRLRSGGDGKPVPVDWRFYLHFLHHPLALRKGCPQFQTAILVWLGRMSYFCGYAWERSAWKSGVETFSAIPELAAPPPGSSQYLPGTRNQRQ